MKGVTRERHRSKRCYFYNSEAENITGTTVLASNRVCYTTEASAPWSTLGMVPFGRSKVHSESQRVMREDGA